MIINKGEKMNLQLSKLSLVILSTALLISACDSDDLVNTKVEQSKVLQHQVSEFASACNGRLSMAIEQTGDMLNPSVNRLSCDDMDKKSELFTAFTEDELRLLKIQIKRINNLE